MKTRQTIKDWELETGVEIVNPKGFISKSERHTEKNKVRTNKYTREQFNRRMKKSLIRIKTQKGEKYYKGEFEDYE